MTTKEVVFLPFQDSWRLKEERITDQYRVITFYMWFQNPSGLLTAFFYQHIPFSPPPQTATVKASTIFNQTQQVTLPWPKLAPFNNCPLELAVCSNIPIYPNQIEKLNLKPDHLFFDIFITDCDFFTF